MRYAIAVLSSLIFFIAPPILAEPEAKESDAKGFHLHVEGMQSVHCERFLESTLARHIDQIDDIQADHESGWVWVEIDPSDESEQALREVIEGECSFTVTEIRRDPPSGQEEKTQTP